MQNFRRLTTRRFALFLCNEIKFSLAVVLRIILALSVGFAHAAPAGPPQLKSGGDGSVPPKYPPTTYGDPSGSDKGKKKPIKLDKSEGKPLAAGSEVFMAKSPEGAPVYYDTGTDLAGLRKVWAYFEGGGTAFYRFGVITTGGEIDWQSKQSVGYVSANYPEAAVDAKTPLPSNMSLTVTDGKNYGPGSGQSEISSPQSERVLSVPGVTLAHEQAAAPAPPATPAAPAAVRFSIPSDVPPTARDPYLLEKSPEGAPIYYDTQKDPQGRRQVWSYIEPETGNPYYRFGVIDGGKVVWQATGRIRYPSTVEGVPAAEPVTAQAPEHQAVTVTDGKTYSPGSGQSEDSTARREKVTSSDDVARFRPSQIEDTLAMTDADRQQTKAEIDAFLKQANTGVKLQQFAGRLATATGSATGRAALGVGAIYTMLGLTAAAKLMLSKTHPNDPMLLDQYLQQFDALHFAMLGGFMLAAGPFLKRIPGMGSMRVAPMMGAALIAGAIADVGVQVFADPDVDKCLAIEVFEKTGKAANDMAACDRAYAKFNSEQMALRFLPQITQVVATGAIVVGSYWVANITGVAGLLTRLPVIKTANPSAVGVGLVALSIAAWIGADWVARQVLNVATNTQEALLAKFPLWSNDYGAGLADSETLLLKGWSTLKAAQWQDVATYTDSKCKYMNVPEAGLIVPPVQYDCPPLDFNGILARHAHLQDEWRGGLMAQTYAAYGQWANKVQDYHAQLGAAYELYSDFINRVEFENANPGLAASDLRGFNATVIATLEQVGLQTGDPLYKQDFSGVWKYVYTPDFPNYVVASMACGPEAQGQKQSTSWLENTGVAISTYITGNTSPTKVIRDRTGRAVVFRPPRIVRVQAGTNRSVCESPVTDFARPRDFMVDAPWFSGQKSYRNMYDYIKDNVSQEIVFDGANTFPDWWNRNVIAPAIKTEADLRSEYVELLKTTYTTALTSDQYYSGWCNEIDLKGVSFARYWAKLVPAQSPQSCGRMNLHRLAMGLNNSLLDQLRLYLAMIADVYVDSFASENGNAKAAESVVIPVAQDLMAAMDNITKQATIVDAKSRTDFNTLSKDAVAKFQRLRNVVFPVYDDNQERTPPQKIIEALLNERIQPLFSQTQAFFTILRTFEPAPPPDSTPPPEAP